MLRVHQSWQPPEATYPNGTHVCELEVDPQTGATEIVNYVVVDDFGVTLNPLMLQGQVHGGAAQGIGQALMEEIRFDESGQMLTATFMDYAMPRAIDIPNFHFETRNVRCVTNAHRREGRGRGRGDRRLPGGDERDGRCARTAPPASRRSTCRRRRSRCSTR